MLLQESDHLAALAEGVAESRAGRRSKVHVELTLIRVGHPGEAQLRNEQERDHDGHDCDRANDEPVSQRPTEPGGIVVGDALEPIVECESDPANRIDLATLAWIGRRMLRLGIGPHAREHGVEREGDEQRHENREGDGYAELEKDLADHPAHERDREEHGHDGQRRRRNGEPDLVGSFLGCAIVVFPHLDVSNDVLAHYDGIVDEEADRERQRQQRHGVHCEAEQPHDEERRDDRHGQRQPGNDSRPPRIQEQIDDRDSEQCSKHDRVLHVGERLANAF